MTRFDMVRLTAWQSAMDNLDTAQATVWNLGYDQSGNRAMHQVETTERLWLACDALRDAVEVLIDLITVDEKAKNRLADKWKLDDSQVDGYRDLLGPVHVLAVEVGRSLRRNGYVYGATPPEELMVAGATIAIIGTLPDVAEPWIEDRTTALMEDAQQHGWPDADVVLSEVATSTEAEFEEFYQDLTDRYRGKAKVKLAALVAEQVIRNAKEQAAEVKS